MCGCVSSSRTRSNLACIAPTTSLCFVIIWMHCMLLPALASAPLMSTVAGSRVCHSALCSRAALMVTIAVFALAILCAHERIKEAVSLQRQVIKRQGQTLHSHTAPWRHP